MQHEVLGQIIAGERGIAFTHRALQMLDNIYVRIYAAYIRLLGVIRLKTLEFTIKPLVFNTTKSFGIYHNVHDTYPAYVGGLISGSGSIELMYDAPSAGDKLDLITDVNQATDEADAAFELYLDEAGGKKITGLLVVTGSEYSATVGEIEVITISFVTSGALTLTI